MVLAGDCDRVELDRPELPEDLEHPVEAGEGPRRREEVPRKDKAARRLCRDLHIEDASCVSVDRFKPKPGRRGGDERWLQPNIRLVVVGSQWIHARPGTGVRGPGRACDRQP